jgi:hypothetical protein
MMGGPGLAFETCGATVGRPIFQDQKSAGSEKWMRDTATSDRNPPVKYHCTSPQSSYTPTYVSTNQTKYLDTSIKNHIYSRRRGPSPCRELKDGRPERPTEVYGDEHESKPAV